MHAHREISPRAGTCFRQRLFTVLPSGGMMANLFVLNDEANSRRTRQSASICSNGLSNPSSFFTCPWTFSWQRLEMSDKLSAKLVFSADKCFLKHLDQDAGKDRIRPEWTTGLIFSTALGIVKNPVGLLSLFLKFCYFLLWFMCEIIFFTFHIFTFFILAQS